MIYKFISKRVEMACILAFIKTYDFAIFTIIHTWLMQESIQQQTENNWSSLNASYNNGHNRNSSTLGGTRPNISTLFSPTENHTLTPNLVEHRHAQPTTFHTAPSVDKTESYTLQSNEAMMEESSSTTLSNAFSTQTEFIDPESVSMASITVTVAPFINGPNKILILHRDIPLQFHCNSMRIRFGLSKQYVDHAGNPRLSFVVDIPSSSNLCNILDACDNIAKRFVDSNGLSQWRPVVSRNPGFYNSPTIRLQ